MALGNLGMVYQFKVITDDAISHFTQPRHFPRNRQRSEGHARGTVYDSQGQYDEDSIAIAREIGNKSAEGINLGNLGSAYHSQGQYDEAIAPHPVPRHRPRNRRQAR